MSKLRLQAFEQLAFDLEMQFTPTDEWSSFELLRDFRLFRNGSRKGISNLLQKQSAMLEMEVSIFDYQYTVSTGKSSVTYKQTVFFMQSTKLGLPHFWMKPEHFGHHVAEWLHLSKDIDFEEFPKFSEQYWLKGEDEDYIRASMNDQVLRFFTVEKEWFLEGCNYYLIIYRHNKLLPPGIIKDFYKKGMKICEMLYADNEERNDRGII